MITEPSISAIRTAFDQTQSALREKLDERERLDQEIAQLKTVAEGFRLYLARENGQLAPDSIQWSRLGRSDAVRMALKVSSRPQGPSQIRQFLERQGREGDKTPYVSAALAYLKRRGEVESAGRGKWRLKGPTN